MGSSNLHKVKFMDTFFFLCAEPQAAKERKAANPQIYDGGTSRCLTFLLAKGLKLLIDYQTDGTFFHYYQTNHSSATCSITWSSLFC